MSHGATLATAHPKSPEPAILKVFENDVGYRTGYRF